VNGSGTITSMGWKTLRSLVVALPVLGVAMLTSGEARAVGEMKSGFPNWAERVLLEWTNRARVDPSIEMKACGTPCAEGACYAPKPPVYWSDGHGHAARFHSAEQIKQGYFGHDSKCQVTSTINSLYPATCDGSASCACSAASPITTWSARVGLFGVSASGEIIASPSDPNSAFYLWLFENSTTTTCGFTLSNGHRYNILTAGPAVGYGVDGYSTGDFGGGGDVSKIPSGSHYPEGGASVDLWANWYDTAGPSLSQVNVGGTCQTMTLGRGTAQNGAYTYKATGLSGCTRYYFTFKDSAGTQVTYPTTGSLGIGGGACASWDTTRPAAGAGCSCTPSCTGKTCGDNGCGGSCGACPTGKACDATGACVTTCTPACSGKTCGPDGCGGSCGSCTAPATCSAAGTCITPCVPSCSGKTCGPDGCGGSCGTCTAPLTCGTAGSCACAAPYLACGSSCIDPKTDPAHCGACTNACVAPEVCSAGTCTTSCTAPLVACDRACVDTKTDVTHCGGCTTKCAGGQTCSGGKCVGGAIDAGPTDAGGDSGSKTDTGAGRDTGGPLDLDAADPDGGGNGDAPDAPFEGSCSCRSGVGADPRGPLGLSTALALALLVAHRRRRRDAR
jgi:MYXO-CTERM domain-containing protein